MLLRELAVHLGISKSEVLKQALAAFYREKMNTREEFTRQAPACRHCGMRGFYCECSLDVLEGRAAPQRRR